MMAPLSVADSGSFGQKKKNARRKEVAHGAGLHSDAILEKTMCGQRRHSNTGLEMHVQRWWTNQHPSQEYWHEGPAFSRKNMSVIIPELPERRQFDAVRLRDRAIALLRYILRTAQVSIAMGRTNPIK